MFWNHYKFAEGFRRTSKQRVCVFINKWEASIVENGLAVLSNMCVGICFALKVRFLRGGPSKLVALQDRIPIIASLLQNWFSIRRLHFLKAGFDTSPNPEIRILQKLMVPGKWACLFWVRIWLWSFWAFPCFKLSVKWNCRPQTTPNRFFQVR